MQRLESGTIRGGTVKKLVFAVAGALMMAACSDAPTTPASPVRAPSGRPAFDLICASGYVIAYDENGNPYCAVEETQSRTGQQPSSSRP
jgi:hypothetical protein